MKRITAFILFSLIIICLFTSFHQEDTADTRIKYFKPVKDFGWLTEFKILSECLSLEHFEKTKGRSFDSLGIIMADGKYHPVNIFQYGIFCFDMFRRTGDEVYKTKCLNQFKYLQDTSRYSIGADSSIAFPYKITFRDLKPVWYSGLAQAEGIMYLIRYYYLTGDSRCIPLIHRIRAFMLKPLSEGGTLHQVSDDEIWIEEYPNSKSKPQVLNGFVTVIMALREYCKLFPSDKEANKIFKACLLVHKNWVYKYDLGNSLYYDLGEKQTVGPWYLKFQIVQMKQMFELFGDTLYKDLEMLWASYAFNKPVPGMTGCLLTDTNFSSPAVLKDGFYTASTSLKNLVSPDAVREICLSPKLSDAFKNNICDGVEQTFYSFRNHDSIPQPMYVQLAFRERIQADRVFIQTIGDTLSTSTLHFYRSEFADGSWTALELKSLHQAGNGYACEIPEEFISNLKVDLDGIHKFQVFNLAEVNLQKSTDQKFTYYSHFTSSDFELYPGSNEFILKTRGTNLFVVFYKTANSINDLSKNKWKIYETFRRNKFVIRSEEKLCRFLIVFRNDQRNAAVSISKNN